MAQTGYTPIQLYSTTTPAAVPVAGNLAQGELAINTADGLLFYKDSGNAVQVLASKASAGSDVSGPASSVTNGIVLFSGTTGKVIKDSSSSDGLIYGITAGRGAGAVATNTVFGSGALAANTTASNMVAIGYQALAANTTGAQNLAVGYQSLNQLISGTKNIAVGRVSANTLTTGARNVAVGNSALSGPTTGVATFGAITPGSGYTDGTYSNVVLNYVSGSTASGYPRVTIIVSGGAVTSCVLNTTNAIYAGRGFKDTTTVMTYTGAGAGTGFAISPATLVAASDNIAIGDTAVAFSGLTGSRNIGIGSESAYISVGASDNISIGYQSLGFNGSGSSGSFSTAVGNYALFNNLTASNNTAIGYQAGYATTTGINNTFVGYGTGLGNTTGLANTFLGGSSGSAVTTGSSNTIIGRYTGNQGGLDIRTASNYIVLSDGDGNPRGVFDNNGNYSVASTAAVKASRIDPRTITTTSTATLTPDIQADDQFNLTAQDVGLTVAAPIGTPVDGNKIMFRILDNGTPQTITWDATYTAIGATLPATTTANKMTYVGCIYNSTNLRWDVVAVTTQV